MEINNQLIVILPLYFYVSGIPWLKLEQARTNVTLQQYEAFWAKYPSFVNKWGKEVGSYILFIACCSICAIPFLLYSVVKPQCLTPLFI